MAANDPLKNAQFDEQFEDLSSRLRGFINEELNLSEDKRTSLIQANEEIQNLIEELNVAMEELRQQNLELVEAQSMIAAERQRYRELFEFAPDGYLITDAQGKIIEANQTAAWLLNVPSSTLAGKLIQSFILPASRPEFRMKLNLIAQGRTSEIAQAETGEVQLTPRDKQPVFASYTAAVRTSDAQKSKGITIHWMLRDITRRKTLELELQQLNQELEARVAERTGQLSRANDKLKTATLTLERKNQELQEFISVASHDLQEPFRKILSFGKQLEPVINNQEELDAEHKDFLRRMIHATERMQAMLTGLLNYGRISTLPQNFEPIDLNQSIREVLADLEPRLAQSGGKVEVQPLPQVYGVPLQIDQVFRNLIANALKFHKDGAPPMVTIFTQPLPNGLARISVQDNGIGFDPKYTSRLFQPFQRLGGRSEFEGSGMGLAICRKIVEQHGGSVHATGTPGQGATFSVDLPTRPPES